MVVQCFQSRSSIGLWPRVESNPKKHLNRPSFKGGVSFNTGNTGGTGREHTHPEENRRKIKRLLLGIFLQESWLDTHSYAEASNTSLFRNLSALLLDVCLEHFFFCENMDCCIFTAHKAPTPPCPMGKGRTWVGPELLIPTCKWQAGCARASIITRWLS